MTSWASNPPSEVDKMTKTFLFEGESYTLAYHKSEEPSFNIDKIYQFESIEHFRTNIQMMNMFNTSEDWPNKCHHIQKWFGLKEYIILCHTTDSNRMGISESSLLLSSLSIILSNMTHIFTVPIFIPIYDKWSGCYVGCSIDIQNQVYFRFDSDNLSNIPNNCKSVQGVYQLYSSKIVHTYLYILLIYLIYRII